jgi:hypothetical protein
MYAIFYYLFQIVVLYIKNTIRIIATLSYDHLYTVYVVALQLCISMKLRPYLLLPKNNKSYVLV